MSKKKEIKKVTPQKDTSNPVSFAPEQDFQFVQLDAKLHDVKFESKPTTFFKDAMKRFSKNKASIVASVILGIIIGMAIIVPIADQSNTTTPVGEAAFLPPKWFDNANGFLDGTSKKSNVVIDKSTSLPSDTSAYPEDCIVGGKDSISYSESEINIANTYGYGGSLWLVNETEGTFSGASTAASYAILSDEVTLDVTLSTPDDISDLSSYHLSLLADFDGDGTYGDEIKLTNSSSTYSEVTVNDAFSILKSDSGYISAGSPAGMNLKYAIVIENEGSICIDSLFISNSGHPNDGAVNYSFEDGNSAMLRYDEDNENYAYRWLVLGKSNHFLHKGKITYGSFRFDGYKHVFGLGTRDLGQSEVQPYIDKGWMTYDFSLSATEGPKSFTLTNPDSTDCPIRSVTSEKKVSFGDVTGITLTCEVLNYRFYGYSSMPHFLFGSDNNGVDYFKILFSGLRTSLLLGLICAAINISVGLIWGAVSGYFGGWTDLLMERITEIIGGVPWIVVMTLVILHLGSSFTSFMLALCLTGWMGVASETRSQFYRYKGREYVLASRTLGASDNRLIFKHILPNGIGPVITGAVLMIPSVIFSEASISYLGLGLQGLDSFGVTLSAVQAYLSTAPYLIVTGAIVMSLLMICFNLFGNGLRDAFNPSLKGISE